MSPRAPWRPGPADYAQVFSEHNPWHQSGEVPVALAPPAERPLAKVLWRALLAQTPKRFHLMLGPRRVGKTVVLHQTVRHMLHAGQPPARLWWLRLDHPLLMELPLGELVRLAVNRAGATADKPVYLFLDELTYAKDWDRWLKTFYDDNWPVRIAGTSSAAAALRSGGTESGVGRWEEHFLTPFLFREYLSLHDVKPELPDGATLGARIRATVERSAPLPDLSAHRRRFMLIGGFPELLMAGSTNVSEESAALRSQQILNKDAVERTIWKDIPQAVEVQSPMQLERLLYLLAGQVTGILSPRNVCQSLDGLSQASVNRYIDYLEHSFLIFTLSSYAAREEGKQRRGRKLYFFDGAVRNAALQRGPGPLENPTELGILIENMCAAHLHALGLLSGVRVHHWRDHDLEVDLVFDHPTEPVAFEIATTPGHKQAGLRALADRFPSFRGRTYVVAVDAPARAPDPERAIAGSLSLDQFLLLVAAQAESALATRFPGPLTENPLFR